MTSAVARSATELIAAIQRQGGDAVLADHAPFARDLTALLDLEPADVPDLAAYRAGLAHAFAYYYWKWDPRAVTLYEPLSVAITRWNSIDQPDLDVLCELFDFFFFLVWCFNGSSIEQCVRTLPVMRKAAAGFARTRARWPQQVLPSPGQRIRVAWLAMFADAGDPMSVALRHVAPALLRQQSGFDLLVYAWRFAGEGFLSVLREQGAVCHHLAAGTHSAMIAAIEQRARRDQPTIVISDMNNAIPTALFSRRIAPVQILLQAGMPAWPVRNLDAVFNSFGIDPAIAGWGDAAIFDFLCPWDLAALDPPQDAVELERERAALPRNHRLIGCYGRLVKITEPYLKAVERILLRCPDAAFVTGGTGDPALIRAFAANSPVGNRIHVEARYVPGHTWDRLLDIFLDTWPLQGGESCRATIAKGRPVVTLRSSEMPAMEKQRDTALVAQDWDGFVACTVRLLEDKAAYDVACAASLMLARQWGDPTEFARRLAADLTIAVDQARMRPSATSSLLGRASGVVRRLRRLGGPGS